MLYPVETDCTALQRGCRLRKVSNVLRWMGQNRRAVAVAVTWLSPWPGPCTSASDAEARQRLKSKWWVVCWIVFTGQRSTALLDGCMLHSKCKSGLRSGHEVHQRHKARKMHMAVDTLAPLIKHAGHAGHAGHASH